MVFLKLFKVFVFLKIEILVPLPAFCFAPLMTSPQKAEHNSKILFVVQASKDPEVPELTSDQQANCCASCPYGTWHWLGVGGTIFVILVAAISVITIIDYTVITNS